MAATTTTFRGLFASLLLLLTQTHFANATFWTVTSYLAVSESVSTRSGCTGGPDLCAFTRSKIYTVRATATPTKTSAIPLSTDVFTRSYDNLTIVEVYVDADAFAQRDIVTTRTSIIPTGPQTRYAVPVVYTAPTSCPTPFTVSTYSRVWVPLEMEPHVTGVSTKRETTTNNAGNSAFTFITVIVDSSQVPNTLVPISDTNYRYYIQSCSYPPAMSAATTSRGGSSSGGGSDLDDWEVCSLLTGCTTLATWIIVVATLLPALFVFGFVESYIWFRRLMLGKGALRFGTICWILLSLWVLCFTRQAHSRSLEDQAMLKAKWKTIGFGQRIRLWFKWGFRHSYPVELLGDPKVGGVPGVIMVAPGTVPGAMPGQPPYPGQPQYPGYPVPGYFAPGAEKTVQDQVAQVPGQDQAGQVPVAQAPGQAPYPQYPQYSQYLPPQGYQVPTQPGIPAQQPIAYWGQPNAPAQPQSAHISMVSTLSPSPGPQPGVSPSQSPAQQQQPTIPPQQPPASELPPTTQPGQQPHQ